MDFSGMENGCLDGVLVVEALYGLGYTLWCFGWTFHGCCSLGWEAIFLVVLLSL
jgi:hypothetical protein